MNNGIDVINRWTASISHVAAQKTAVETLRDAPSSTPGVFVRIISTPTWNLNWSGDSKMTNRGTRTRRDLQKTSRSTGTRMRPVRCRVRHQKPAPLASTQRTKVFLWACLKRRPSIWSQRGWQWRRTAAAVTRPILPACPRTPTREAAFTRLRICLTWMGDCHASSASPTTITTRLAANWGTYQNRWRSTAAPRLLNHSPQAHSRTAPAGPRWRSTWMRMQTRPETSSTTTLLRAFRTHRRPPWTTPWETTWTWVFHLTLIWNSLIAITHLGLCTVLSSFTDTQTAYVNFSCSALSICPSRSPAPTS